MAKAAIKKDKEFKPIVKLSKICLYCPYKLDCEPYQIKKEANREKRSKLHKETNGGIVSFGSDEV